MFALCVFCRFWRKAGGLFILETCPAFSIVAMREGQNKEF
ncbi:hypothetical protein CEV33_1587 [Brucella grignonensis]|uniref:Uncharacterized protein n=1 Tax=Brucella grignonensis TaxID=94627 RepID=A0A256FB79_9HYPH|nr:hypothetical protein CEV33_1587 [Brucella grignonensis]